MTATRTATTTWETTATTRADRRVVAAAAWDADAEEDTAAEAVEGTEAAVVVAATAVVTTVVTVVARPTREVVEGTAMTKRYVPNSDACAVILLTVIHNVKPFLVFQNSYSVPPLDIDQIEVIRDQQDKTTVKASKLVRRGNSASFLATCKFQNFFG